MAFWGYFHSKIMVAKTDNPTLSDTGTYIWKLYLNENLHQFAVETVAVATSPKQILF